MARGQKRYTQEFKDTIVELYNSGKMLAELSSKYSIAKINEVKSIAIVKDTKVTAAQYKAMLKKMAKLEEKNKILKKAMTIFAKE